MSDDNKIDWLKIMPPEGEQPEEGDFDYLLDAFYDLVETPARPSMMRIHARDVERMGGDVAALLREGSGWSDAGDGWLHYEAPGTTEGE